MTWASVGKFPSISTDGVWHIGMFIFSLESFSAPVKPVFTHWWETVVLRMYK